MRAPTRRLRRSWTAFGHAHVRQMAHAPWETSRWRQLGGSDSTHELRACSMEARHESSPRMLSRIE